MKSDLIFANSLKYGSFKKISSRDISTKTNLEIKHIFFVWAFNILLGHTTTVPVRS